MCTCACVCVCIFVCAYMCICTCRYVLCVTHTNAYVYVLIHMSTHTITYTYACAYTRRRIFIYMFQYTYICMCMHAFAFNAEIGGWDVSSLADMFAPPTKIIYAGPGGFQGARQAAKDARRWLLVNIQSDSDFACHALNRDVWRDELVENLVRDGFIFWQAVDTTSEGSTYSERYRVGGYPHVAIIDPRTARLMWKKEGWTQVNPMTPVQFAETAAGESFVSHSAWTGGMRFYTCIHCSCGRAALFWPDLYRFQHTPHSRTPRIIPSNLTPF